MGNCAIHPFCFFVIYWSSLIDSGGITASRAFNPNMYLGEIAALDQRYICFMVVHTELGNGSGKCNCKVPAAMRTSLVSSKPEYIMTTRLHYKSSSIDFKDGMQLRRMYTCRAPFTL